MRVPGHAEIVVNRQQDEDVYVAMRDAFDAVARRIEEVVRIKRGDVKSHDPVLHGTVTRIVTDDGIGFIETRDGREFYFSRDNVAHPAFEHLKSGMAVQFIDVVSDEGLQAKRASSGKHQVPEA